MTLDTRRSGRGTLEERSHAQRDRDRILYADAFRRLAGVTQVIGALERHPFHNRLTHTLEVAQIARRVSEQVHGQLNRKLLSALGVKTADDVVNPDRVEAAALAHDLGHPPFGHIAEHELDTLVKDQNDADGFEGNAQSFRIVTRLAAHEDDDLGLDLTCGTLNAVLKYPWLRGGNLDYPDQSKFGAYRDDAAAFDFARALGPAGFLRSVEAEIMDFADAVAYSIHDLTDFYQGGLLPIDQLAFTGSADPPVYFQRFFDENKQHFIGSRDPADESRLMRRLWSALAYFVSEQPYDGRREQRVGLRRAKSQMIAGLTQDVHIVEQDGKPSLVLPQDWEVETDFLKRLIRVYVIDRPQLASQQYGQRQLVAALFDYFIDVIGDEKNRRRLVPTAFHRDLDRAIADGGTGPARLAADLIASLSEADAHALYLRVSGIQQGAVTDLMGA